MINQIEIRNFRCFKHAKLTGLQRFNFVVGESGTGKTALIEALFLVGGGNPEIWFRLRRWRGIGEGPIQIGIRANYEALFRDLFYNFEQENGAFLRILDSSKGKRELEIYYEESNVLTIPVGERTEQDNAFAIDPINFKWDFGNRVSYSKVEIKDNNLRMTGTAEVYPIFLISPRTFSGRENAQFFSNLSRTKRAGTILDAIKGLFNEIEDISIELVAGEPLLHLSLPGLDEKLPLGDLSGGLSRYVEIVLAILSNPGGVVLIDEIENGFYYRNLPKLLKNIVYLCDLHQVQLFATTHSYEFLQAMTGVMESARRGRDDFALLRMERNGIQPPEIRSILGESFEAAVKEDFEIR